MFASVGTSRSAGQEWAGTCSLVLVRWYIAFSRAGGGRDMFASVGTLVHRVQSGRRGQGHVR